MSARAATHARSLQAHDPKGDTKVRVVGILLFPGFEILDSMGPAEVFGCASFESGGSAFEIQYIALDLKPVSAAAGYGGTKPPLLMQPTMTVNDAAALNLDIILVPGGVAVCQPPTKAGGRPSLFDPSHPNDPNAPGMPYVEYLKKLAALPIPPLITSVCTGASFLAVAGLLKDRPATTNHMAWNNVTKFGAASDPAAKPNIQWLRGPRWVDSGSVVTSAGVSAGIDMALHIVARLLGTVAAYETAIGMEYRWDPSEELKGIVKVVQ